MAHACGAVPEKGAYSNPCDTALVPSVAISLAPITISLLPRPSQSRFLCRARRDLVLDFYRALYHSRKATCRPF